MAEPVSLAIGGFVISAAMVFKILQGAAFVIKKMKKSLDDKQKTCKYINNKEKEIHAVSQRVLAVRLFATYSYKFVFLRLGALYLKATKSSHCFVLQLRQLPYRMADGTLAQF